MEKTGETTNTCETILSKLKENPRGLTIRQVVDTTGFSRETVTRHLMELKYQNEVYTVRFGNVDVYCSNHREKKDKDVKRVNLGNRTIFINRLENEFGEFIKISETRKAENRWETRGSILVKPEDVKQLIQALKEIDKRPGEVQDAA